MLSTALSKTVMGSTVKAAVDPPSTLSESIVVMDGDTGEILYDKNGTAQNMPASTTKVMTALLALENLDMEQMITVGENPPYAEGASMGFKAGEEVMAIDLVYALFLHSANDAAEILAEAVSGTIEEFAELMTAKAKELGAVDTVFKNPSGLHEEGNNNYTTAKDLAIITAAAGRNEKLLEIAGTRSHMLPLTNLVTDMNRWATNKNDMMIKSSQYYYEPVIMGKTGWTPAAGYAYTAMGVRDGRSIVVSILRGVNQGTYWTETKELMEWAFTSTSVHTLYKRGQEMKKIILANGDEMTLVAKEDFNLVSALSASPTPILEFDEIIIDKDYVSGDVIDTVRVMVDNEEVGTVELVCESDIILTEEEAAKEEESILGEEKDNTLKKAFSLTFGILAVFTLMIFGIRVLNTSKRRRRRKMSTKRLEYLQRRENSKHS
jgi:D-alanyl-D-alanine carboxypeptidase